MTASKKEIIMVSTRGRYALRVMIDLALNQGDGYVPDERGRYGTRACHCKEGCRNPQGDHFASKQTWKRINIHRQV